MIRLFAVTALVLLTGCTSVLTAARDTPIEDDRGTRTLGSSIDDQFIETKVSVNVNKAHTDIEKQGRISVTSYNGVVLLAGQVPRQDLIEIAGQAAKNTQRVKVVQTGGGAFFIPKQSAAYFTTFSDGRPLSGLAGALTAPSGPSAGAGGGLTGSTSNTMPWPFSRA